LPGEKTLKNNIELFHESFCINPAPEEVQASDLDRGGTPAGIGFDIKAATFGWHPSKLKIRNE